MSVARATLVPRPVRWTPREPPLDPGAVYTRGAGARALVGRLRSRDARRLEGLRGVATESGVLVVGPTASLPWCDGALYLGRTSDAPTLWLPCLLQPDVPLDLYERAVRAHTAAQGEIAVIPENGVVLGLRRATAVDEAWLARANEVGQ